MLSSRMFALLLVSWAMGWASISSAQTFRDDFDGNAVDTALWVVEPGDGQVTVDGGVITLSCAGSTFPVVTSRIDPFPPGDFRVRVGMQYLSQSSCGDGFGAMDNFWEDYNTGTACRPFLIWQDPGGLYAHAGSAGAAMQIPGDTAYHLFEWTYLNGTYEFSMDGVVRASGGCAPRATQLFFGHPHPIGCSPWTSFAIDFIEVSPIGATAMQRTTWGEVKELYR
jgi:hypothetical protein